VARVDFRPLAPYAFDMIDLQFKLAGGILCLVVLISSFTSGVGGVLQPRDAEVDFSGMPECSSKICVPYAPSLPFILLLVHPLLLGLQACAR